MIPTLTLLKLTFLSETNLALVIETLDSDNNDSKQCVSLEKCIWLSFIEQHSMNNPCTIMFLFSQDIRLQDKDVTFYKFTRLNIFLKKMRLLNLLMFGYSLSVNLFNSFAARSDVRGVAQCKCSCEKCQKWPFKLSNCNLCCLCDASSACGSYDTVPMVPYVLQNWSYYCRMIFMMSESWHNYHTTRSIM